MKEKGFMILNQSLLIFVALFMSHLTFSEKISVNKKENQKEFSFRPLLIQGKKRLIQKTKDMKVEAGNIIESEVVFIDIDVKKRIFEGEILN